MQEQGGVYFGSGLARAKRRLAAMADKPDNRHHSGEVSIGFSRTISSSSIGAATAELF
jgi:hypothetical protein